MQSKDLRNVIFLGHGGTGKTTMAEAMLYNSKAIDRLGKIADGNTTLDYDPEEIKRQFSIYTAVAPVDWKGNTINIIDAPGAINFDGEMLEGASVADSAVIVLAGRIAVSAERGWDLVNNRKMPRCLFFNKLNDESVDFFKLYDEVKEQFGASCVPIQLPIIENRKFVGYIDTLRLKAKKFTSNGETADCDIPASLKDMAEEIHGNITELVAETDDALMERYFEGEAFSEEELTIGLMKAVKACIASPILCGAATDNQGMRELVDFIVDSFPSPVECQEFAVFNENYEPVKIKLDTETSPVLFIFKTIVDSAGKLSMFKVVTGTVKSGDILHNVEKNCDERLGQLVVLKGKKQIPVNQLAAGDIGAVAKLTNTDTSDTLSSKGNAVIMPRIIFPEPQHSQSISCLKKGDEDKMTQALTKMMDEDKMFTFGVNTETNELVITAYGEKHLDILMSRLKSRYGIEVKLAPPKVAYRETIRKKVTEEYTHKKQSGGSGQYGKVVIDFEPGTQEELEFCEKIVGGSVPKQYFPSVEKGLQESVKKGVLAGYPVVRLKATLVDGKYHPVDSKEVAFVTAASMAYRNALPKASPVLLEPISNVRVLVPDKYMGDVIADLNKRRGKVLGMNPVSGGKQEVEADVPAAELFTYATDLRSIAHARATYTQTFARYEEVPGNVAQTIIDAAKAEAEE